MRCAHARRSWMTHMNEQHFTHFPSHHTSHYRKANGETIIAITHPISSSLSLSLSLSLFLHFFTILCRHFYVLLCAPLSSPPFVLDLGGRCLAHIT